MVSVADGWHHGPRREQGRPLGSGRAGPGRARAPRRGARPRSGLRSELRLDRRELEHAGDGDRAAPSRRARPARANRASNCARVRSRPAPVSTSISRSTALMKWSPSCSGIDRLEHEHAAAGRHCLPAVREERHARVVVPVVHDRLASHRRRSPAARRRRSCRRRPRRGRRRPRPRAPVPTRATTDGRSKSTPVVPGFAAQDRGEHRAGAAAHVADSGRGTVYFRAMRSTCTLEVDAIAASNSAPASVSTSVRYSQNG